MSNFLVAGDDVVAHKHGEKSAQALSSAGFRNLTFRSYNGYIYLPLGIIAYPNYINILLLALIIIINALLPCRLGHYTIPEEMDEVCNWLTTRIGLDGPRS